MPKQARKKNGRSPADKEKVQKLLELLDLSGLNPCHCVPLGSGHSINEFFNKYNSLYRKLVRDNRDDYVALHHNKKQKQRIAKGIIKRIHGNNGKFLEWNEVEDHWREVTDEKRLLEKAEQSLREGATIRRQELEEKKMSELKEKIMRELREEKRQEEEQVLASATAGFQHHWQCLAPKHGTVVTPPLNGNNFELHSGNKAFADSKFAIPAHFLFNAADKDPGATQDLEGNADTDIENHAAALPPGIRWDAAADERGDGLPYISAAVKATRAQAGTVEDAFHPAGTAGNDIGDEELKLFLKEMDWTRDLTTSYKMQN